VVVIELCQSRNSILTIDESTIADVSGITLGINIIDCFTLIIIVSLNSSIKIYIKITNVFLT